MRDADTESRSPALEPAGVFGVLHGRSDGRWHARMVPGSWLCDAEGLVVEGSLGVLADIAFSMPGLIAGSSLAGQGSGRVPVTQSLRLDLCVPAAFGAGPLIAGARLVHRAERQALVQGEIRDGEDRVIAVGSLQSAYVRSTAEIPLDREPGPLVADAQGSLADVFPPPERLGGAATLRLTPQDRLGNPRYELHGGVTAVLADWAGIATLDGGRSDWALASLGVDYLRPAPLGQELAVDARCEHEGRRAAFVEVRFVRSDGVLFARASLVYLWRAGRAGSD